MPAAAESRDDLLAKFASMAKSHTDSFRVKVDYRPNVGARETQILSMDGARVVHLSDPETWIPRLIGGSGQGSFSVRVAHSETPAAPLGSFDLRIGGASKVRADGTVAVDFSATDDADYEGPTTFLSPRRPNADAPTADLLSIARGTDARGEPARVAFEPARASSASPSPLADELIAREQAVSRKERNVEIEAIRQQAQLDAQRAQAETKAAIDRAQAEAKEREARLVEEMRRVTAAVATAPAAPPVIPGLAELLTEVRTLATRAATPAPERVPSMMEKLLTPELLTTLVMGVLATSKESAAAREAANMRMIEMQAASAKEARELILSMKDKDGGVGEFMKMLAGVQAQSMTQQATMMDMMMRMMKEMTPEEDEGDPPWLKLAREALGLMAANAAGTNNLQRDLAQIAQDKALPEGEGDEDALEPDRSFGDAGAGAQRQTNAKVTKLPSRSLVQIKRSIMAMQNAREVASLFLNAYQNDPDFQREINAYGGDDAVEKMFREHLGPWVEQDAAVRGPYAGQLFVEIHTLAEAIAKERTAEAERKPPPKSA